MRCIRLLTLLLLGFALTGCASDQRGVIISTGGTDCCTAMYLEASEDEDGGAMAMYDCLSVDLDGDEFIHDAGCDCATCCICWTIADHNLGQKPKSAKKVDQLMSGGAAK